MVLMFVILDVLQNDLPTSPRLWCKMRCFWTGDGKAVKGNETPSICSEGERNTTENLLSGMQVSGLRSRTCNVRH
jgi:hypothetical protein